MQLSRNDGAPPYLVALADNPEEGEPDFLIGNTPTSVPRRYCLPMDRVAAIATEFLDSGERRLDMTWETI